MILCVMNGRFDKNAISLNLRVIPNFYSLKIKIMFRVSHNLCKFHIFAHGPSIKEEYRIFLKSLSVYDDSLRPRAFFGGEPRDFLCLQANIEGRVRDFSKSQGIYDNSHFAPFGTSPTSNSEFFQVPEYIL